MMHAASEAMRCSTRILGSTMYNAGRNNSLKKFMGLYAWNTKEAPSIIASIKDHQNMARSSLPLAGDEDQ